MTSSDDVGPGPNDSLPPLSDWYSDAEPLLRRLRLTAPVQEALTVLAEAHSSPWSAETAVSIRRAALRIVSEYVEQRVGRSGSVPTEEFNTIRHVQNALPAVGTWLAQDEKHGKALAEKAAAAGVQLDSNALGGAKRVTGKRGGRPHLLTEHVRAILRERFSDWDGESKYPKGANTQELRDWLWERLTDASFDPLSSIWNSGASWGAAIGAHPFRPDEIDPEPGGPLQTIIDNLWR